MMRRVANKQGEGEAQDAGAQNRAQGRVCLIRAPVMPMLMCDAGPKIVFKPFVSPCLDAVDLSRRAPELRLKTLGVPLFRKKLTGLAPVNAAALAAAATEEKKEEPPCDKPPLVLWEPDEEAKEKGGQPVVVDVMLTRFLREHQRFGVKFVFECLMGLKEVGGNGCILADDMGLGKSLQSLSVMWTLLKQGLDGRPAVRKAVVVCPASLVSNWGNELDKWLQGKCPYTAVLEGGSEKVAQIFKSFKYDQRSLVLIASYETFRMHVEKLEGAPVDLVICDEAHKLKNDKTRTAQAINSIQTPRRLLLSGTPIQNDLDEFFSLVSLCNPALFGDQNAFRKTYANPILAGREPDATDAQQARAQHRLAELSEMTNQFILRRTNEILAKVLPPKLMLNVFIRLTPAQEHLYRHFLGSSATAKLLRQSDEGKVTNQALAAIQALAKLCNHPQLVENRRQNELKDCEGVDEILGPCVPGLGQGGARGVRDREERRGIMEVRKQTRPELSGKMLFLHNLLSSIRRNTDDKVVIISNYTQTLDMIENFSKEFRFPCVRLDGSTSRTKRGKLVKTFNEAPPKGNQFLFLLSSKAGGCGINLIGANRLVMMDPDWNPANDKQALARVWRDGQKKQCYVYRLFSTGTLEEKMYQRQIAKDGLSSMIVSEEAQVSSSISADMLKDVFRYRDDTLSDTHEVLACKRCPKGREGDGGTGVMPQLGDLEFVEDDLMTWAHHFDLSTVDDSAFCEAAVHMPAAARAAAAAGEGGGGGASSSRDLNLSTPPDFAPVSFAFTALIKYSEEAEKAKQEAKALRLAEREKAEEEEAERKRKNEEGDGEIDDFELGGGDQDENMDPKQQQEDEAGGKKKRGRPKKDKKKKGEASDAAVMPLGERANPQEGGGEGVEEKAAKRPRKEKADASTDKNREKTRKKDKERVTPPSEGVFISDENASEQPNAKKEKEKEKDKKKKSEGPVCVDSSDEDMGGRVSDGSAGGSVSGGSEEEDDDDWMDTGGGPDEDSDVVLVD